MNSATLAAVLRAVLNGEVEIWPHEELSRADRAFLNLWAEDWTEGAEFTALWDQVGKDALTRGFYPPTSLAVFKHLIECALEARRTAAKIKSGEDPDRREKESRRERLLKLASMADAAADYFHEMSRYSGSLMQLRERLLMPLLKDVEFRRVSEEGQTSILLFPGAYELIVPAHSLQQLHEREANLLREWAGKVPTATTFISRKHKHRERNAFVHSLTEYLCGFGVQADGQPHRKAIATLVNISFPDEYIDEEGVRKILKSPRR
jgi:hypothetical protein